MAQLVSSVRRVSSSDGGVVLDVRRGTMFHLNPLGSKILDLMDKGHSPNEIAHKLSAEFAVSLDLVQADISEFLDALREHELLDSSERTA